MKILLVNTYHYSRGGDCTYTFSLAELLRSQGHEVYYFGMKHPLNIPCSQEKFFVDYIDFRELNQKKTLLNGLRVVSRSIYSIQAKTQLHALLQEIKPDIAHLQNIHSHLTPSVIFELKRQNIPIVWTLHDFKLICPNTHLLSHGRICEQCNGGKFYYCTLKKCKKNSYAASAVATIEASVHRCLHVTDKIQFLISPSEFLRKKFMQFGYKENKIVHINNFLTKDMFRTSPSVDGNYALYFGQLEPWKGVKTLLQVWAEIKGMELKIAGDGSLRNELEKQVVNSRVRNVSFLGQLNKEELFNVLTKASFVIVPSEWYENYPYSVMESMICGKPVLASNIGGLPEMVKDGETGFLFESGDAQSLKDKIDILINDLHLRQKFGQNAKARAISEFDPNIHYKRLMKIYEQSI
jgi:glycosyltransferase involved in cell wall biosynthesis